MKACKHCSSSGIYIDYAPPQQLFTPSTTVNSYSMAVAVHCKYCKGKGYIDEDELMTVPRKYIKDEYFE